MPRFGTEKSRGTKVFALAGQIANTGLIEVPMGISLREIIMEIGGGVSSGRRLQGGADRRPVRRLHSRQTTSTRRWSTSSLRELGSIMGSGGMIVMDDSSYMVDVARYFMEFSMSESCGKCVPCRVGTTQMYNLLDKILAGEATDADLALLEQLCDLTSHTSLCGLGQSAPNPVAQHAALLPRGIHGADNRARVPLPGWSEVGHGYPFPHQNAENRRQGRRRP